MSIAEARAGRSGLPRRLLLALLGEFVVDGYRDPVPASAFIDVLEAAGIGAPTTRASLDRLEQSEVLAREKRGREILFTLTPAGEAMLKEATARVRDPQPFRAAGEGWTLVTFSLPEEQRTLRHRLRSTLTWQGFGALRDGLWVAPGEVDLDAALAPMDGELPAGSVIAFHAHEIPGFAIDQSVDSAWDVAAIRAAHEEFIGTWEAAGQDSGALVTRALLVADWLALVRADPRLPPRYLAHDWPADRSLELYRRYRAETRAAEGDFARVASGALRLAR